MLCTGYDCGVLTCMFADFVAKDCPLDFSQEHRNQCCEYIALLILKGNAIMKECTAVERCCLFDIEEPRVEEASEGGRH